MANGILLIDKPAGVSSAKAIEPLKQRLGRGTKVGHAGTLDPFATGLLLALAGDATRLSHLAVGLPKSYRATVAFGRETDTLDPEGETGAERDPGPAPPPRLAEAVAGFSGEQAQVPPAFSALKVDGRRAYRLAREGRPAEMEPRPVCVHELVLREVSWPEVVVELVCGAGFYVRAFARDLGRALGLPAHLAALRRTGIGPFDAADGVAPGAADPARLLDCARLVEAAGLAWVELGTAAARAFAAGQAVVVAPLPPAPRVGVRSGALFVGLGRCERPDGVRPEVVLAGARRQLESGA